MIFPNDYMGKSEERLLMKRLLKMGKNDLIQEIKGLYIVIGIMKEDIEMEDLAIKRLEKYVKSRIKK